MSRITALLYFAQSSADSFLQALEAEKVAIEEGLRKPVENGTIQLLVQPETALAGISNAISIGGNEVALVHFAGHAERKGIRLRDGTALTKGLVAQLRAAGQLKLIFLNACSTIHQVELFMNLPGAVVLATTCPVADGQATYFAARFYEALGLQRNIREAYQIASGAMKTRWSVYQDISTPPLAVTRGLGFVEQDIHPKLPWQLYYDPDQAELLEWHLPYPTLNTIPLYRPGQECIGRERELQQLSQQLFTITDPLVIRGIGGTGKSTLAAAWATQQKSRYEHLIWVNSEQQLLSFFYQNTSLQSKLQLRNPSPQEGAAEYFVYCLERLKQLPGKNLILFDNIDRQQLMNQVADRPLWQHLQFPNHWDVLLTSREKLPFFQEYYLESLSESAAATLFTTYCPLPAEHAELLVLLREIGYHALTIELLSKTVAAMSGLLSLRELIDQIRAFRLDHHDLQEPIFTTHNGQEAGVYQQLSFAFRLTNISASQLSHLRRRALLPAEPMLIEHLAMLLEEPPIALNRTLNQLAKLGWLQKAEGTFSMHRMVQEVVLYQSKPTRNEINPLRNALKQQFQHNQFSRDQRIFWALTSLPLARWVVVQPILDQNDGFWLNGLVDTLQEPVFQENVRFLLENSLRLAEQGAKEEYVFELLVYFYKTYLALTYKTLGQYKEALDLAIENRTYTALRSGQNILAKLKGEEPDDTINWEVEQIQCYSLIVRIHLAEKDVGQALAENQKMLKRISQWMPTHPDDPRIPIIVTTLTDLVQILQTDGDYLNALELSESALSFLDNQITFSFFKAKSLGYLGRFAEAVPLFEKVLARQDEFQTEYSYLNAVEEYALLLSKNQQAKKAKDLFLHILTQKPQILPPKHVEIAHTHLYLALAYFRLSDLENARQHLRTAITDFPVPLDKFIEGSYALALVLQSAQDYVASNEQLRVTIKAYDTQGTTGLPVLSCMLYQIQNHLKMGTVAEARSLLSNARAYALKQQITLGTFEQQQLDGIVLALRE